MWNSQCSQKMHTQAAFASEIKPQAEDLSWVPTYHCWQPANPLKSQIQEILQPLLASVSTCTPVHTLTHIHVERNNWY